ncbi:MAG: hypothetical protein P8104_10155, partial [Gammaproteobacteria bacterium]
MSIYHDPEDADLIWILAQDQPRRSSRLRRGVAKFFSRCIPSCVKPSAFLDGPVSDMRRPPSSQAAMPSPLGAPSVAGRQVSGEVEGLNQSSTEEADISREARQPLSRLAVWAMIMPLSQVMEAMETIHEIASATSVQRSFPRTIQSRGAPLTPVQQRFDEWLQNEPTAEKLREVYQVILIRISRDLPYFQGEALQQSEQVQHAHDQYQHPQGESEKQVQKLSWDQLPMSDEQFELSSICLITR